MTEPEVTLREYLDYPGYPFVERSAPDRFARLLADLEPAGWRIDYPDDDLDAEDLWLAATAVGTCRGVAITADRPAESGYRPSDEWTVDASGDLLVRLTLYHGDGPESFAAAIRVLRAAGTLPPEPTTDVPATAGQEGAP